NAVEPLHFLGDSLTDRRQSLRARVAVDALIHGSLGAFANLYRDLGIANALGQVDALDLFARHRHGANFRLHGAGCALAQRKRHIANIVAPKARDYVAQRVSASYWFPLAEGRNTNL